MSLDFFILGGYGHYVWPAFFFAFISFATLYRISRKELQKHEKLFLVEYKELKAIKIKSTQGNKKIKDVLLGSST
tara:strand:- start:4793 stop:5017 length:225 start_codon:yes stop_codon:yes gene_type:complete